MLESRDAHPVLGGPGGRQRPGRIDTDLQPRQKYVGCSQISQWVSSC